MELSSNKRGRVFPQEFKLAVVMRMREGEAVSALARTLGIRRKVLYGWKQGFGDSTLNHQTPFGERG